jgi:hypothetical protein
MNGQRDLDRRINERLESERLRRSVAGFHALKKSPEAADPESPVAEKVRRLNRERRNELGRPRKRRRGGNRGVPEAHARSLWIPTRPVREARINESLAPEKQ